MLKKFYAIMFLLFAFFLAQFNGQVVFANQLPQTVRVIYTYANIYTQNETIIEATPKEDRATLVAKVAFLHDTFAVVAQTDKMFEIEFEKDQATHTGFIYKSVVIDNSQKSPTKYLQTNATITKNAEVFKKEDGQFVKVANITLEKGFEVRVLEEVSSKNEYTLISFNHQDNVAVYYVKTNFVKANGLSRSFLTAITLITISLSAGGVLLTIFKRANQRKKQQLLSEDN